MESRESAKPIAVLISDVHYSLSTLELADKAFRSAIYKAAELNVPLIDCGDLTNDKAILRGEVINALIAVKDLAYAEGVRVISLVGNHSLLNEKSSDHTLAFLRHKHWHIVDQNSGLVAMDGMAFIPYHSDLNALRSLLSQASGKIVIMHQGLNTAAMGHYIQDPTALSPEDVRGLRVISGHYHAAQDIKVVSGLFSYVGNPYTLTFGEAKDPPKGIAVLYDNGFLERIPLNLRKHEVIEARYDELPDLKFSKDTPLWLKVSGPQSELQKLDKNSLGLKYLGHSNYKLDLIFDSQDESLASSTEIIPLSDDELFDNIIDSQSESQEQKQRLKSLWRSLVNSVSNN